MPPCLRSPSLFDPQDYKRRREVELKHGRVRGPGIVPTVILGVSQNEGDSKSPSKWFSAVGNHMDVGQWQPLVNDEPLQPKVSSQGLVVPVVKLKILQFSDPPEGSKWVATRVNFSRLSD